jgi:hypothetical protein
VPLVQANTTPTVTKPVSDTTTAPVGSPSYAQNQYAKRASFADGGAIAGPGGPRDDNLLVRASNGEFVVPADVVRHKGTEFFHKLIDKTRETSPGFSKGFAEGGEVVDPTQAIDLPASSSPGLGGLPAEGQASDSGAATDAAITSAEQGAAPAAVAAPAARNPVTAYKAERTADDQQYVKNLPTDQKIALALQAFGAGVTGGPNPIDVLLARKQKREAEFRAEFTTNLQNIKEAVDIVRRTPPGKARDALVEQLTRSAGPNAPFIEAALKGIGTAQEDAFKQNVQMFSNPAVQSQLTTMCGASPDPQGCLQGIMKNKEAMEDLQKRGDAALLPQIYSKMGVISRTMGNMPQYRDANGNPSFTKIDLMAQNAALPPNLQLSPAELQTIERNQVGMIPFGFKTDKQAEIGQEAQARKEAAGTWSDPYEMNGAQVQKNSATGEIRTAVTRAPVTNVTVLANAIPKASADLHGDEFLSTLPQATQNVVKGLTDYTMDPSKLSARQGQREAYIAQAKQVDPNYDPSKFQIRQGLKKDIASGPTSNNIVAIGQTINHMGTYKELMDAVANGDVQTTNQLVNRVKQEFGRPDITSAQFAQQAVATELMRTFRQVNADAQEVKRFEDQLGAARNSPAQTAGVLKTGAKLLVGRLDELNQKYDRTMDTTTGIPRVLSPQASAGLQRLGVNWSGGQPQASAGAPASAAPPVGTVKQGYRFKGGNPADKSNWEKV